MQCPACQLEFHNRLSEWKEAAISIPDSPLTEIASITLCPKCHRGIVGHAVYLDDIHDFIDREIVYPVASRQIEVDLAVPEHLAAEFVEASNVLPISPKASAALSLRILQAILKEQGYTNRDLAKQVDAVLGETDAHRVLPFYVRDKIDAIRNFGDFSAHPITDLTTLQIIDVEPEEAEWCLDIVSALFEHYYIRPADDKRKLNELNQKLASAGKPPAKQ